MGQCLSTPKDPKLSSKEKPRFKKRHVDKALIGLPRDFQHVAHGGADGMVMTPGTTKSQLDALKNKMDDFAKILDDMGPTSLSSEILPEDLPNSSTRARGESRLPCGEENFIAVLSAQQNSSSGTLDDILKFKDPTGSIFIPKTMSSAGIRESCEEASSPLSFDESKTSQQRSLEGLFEVGGVALSESVTSHGASHLSKISLPILPLPLIDDLTSEDNLFMDLPKAFTLDSSPALIESTFGAKFNEDSVVANSKTGSISTRSIRC